MDRCQKFGIVALLITLFLLLVFTQGYSKILYLSGIVYALIFIFHASLERWFSSWVKRPLLAYGVGVVINGLVVETLAYFSNYDKILANEKVFLFSDVSLLADLFVSLPYYITFAIIFTWAVRKYKLSAFEMGVSIWFAQAMTTDMFTHFLALFSGDPLAIVGFTLAGFTMLLTLHAPIVFFEKKIEEHYPARISHWSKYPIVMVLQILPIIITFVFAFTARMILHLNV